MLSAVTSRITPATAVCVFRRSAACSEDKRRCFHNALQRRYIEERALLRAGQHVEVVLRINFWFVLLLYFNYVVLACSMYMVDDGLLGRSTGIICSGSGALFLPLRRSAFMYSIIVPTSASRALSLLSLYLSVPRPPSTCPPYACNLQYAVRCLQLHRRRDERECRHGLDRCQQPGHPSARMQGAAQHRRRGMQMHGDAQKCTTIWYQPRWRSCMSLGAAARKLRSACVL